MRAIVRAIGRPGLALAAMLLPSAVAAQDRGDAPGRGFDVTAYALALTPDLARRSVTGHETVALRVVEDGLDHLAFSANALTIDRASVNGVPVMVDARRDALAVVLPRPLAAGRIVRLTFDYHGTPARGLVASASGIYSSYFACDWMVCVQDAFGDKADFTIDLDVPRGFQTLSAGTMTRRTPTAAREVHRWRAPRAYPAYLHGFAVGHFARVEQEVDGMRLAYLGDADDMAPLASRFADTPEIARFMAGRAGVPLPAAPYTQLLVDGDEAQEAATWSVLGTAAVPERPGDAARDWGIAHELAHQWWGNLVTCRTLRDFWLNEGIAVFMTAAWKEHRFGRAAYDAELDLARTRLARARDAGYDKPLAWAGSYPSLGLRRAVQYSKGALFMDHLRSLLGETAFWAGLRRYTRVHAGGTVTSVDLERAMTVASGRDLRPLFTQWVYGAGEAPPR